MKRLVLAAPDAFKGTCDSAGVAQAMALGARRAGWGCDRCPLSDGGEGFATVLASLASGGARGHGTWRTTRVTGPLGTPVAARWWWAPPEAIVESAAASGLALVGGASSNDPLAATSRGTGELIAEALEGGADRVLVGVGGSASTDGGRGALEVLEERGGFGRAEVLVACDVVTLFLDAARDFAPQKGASTAQVAELRKRLSVLAGYYRERFAVDVVAMPGSGAAGGLAGGLAVLGAKLVPGLDLVATRVGLDRRIGASGLVMTGEGRLDSSSWSGKVVGGVVSRARKAKVPVLVLAGSVGPGGLAVPPGTESTPANHSDGAGPSETAELWGDGLVEVVSLTERFGRTRALVDPASCVEAAVQELLAAR